MTKQHPPARRLHRAGLALVCLCGLATSGCPSPGTSPATPASPRVGADGPAPQAGARTVPLEPREVHLANVRQLTFGGENAEAYWSFDSTRLIFQTTRKPFACDQIMTMPAGGGPATLVSTGKGRTTCAYFLRGDKEIVYSSTHHVDAACPKPPDRSLGYTWGLYDFDIFKAKPDGSGLSQLTNSKGYDAEATVCPTSGDIIFTSTRDGDLELYRMDADGKNVKRLTNAVGYDGGAFFSADCTQIVWRASRPEGAALADYKRLLAQNLVRPSKLELFVANADGTNQRQITHLGVASFGPYFHPSGKRVLFSSNYSTNAGSKPGREFDIWAVNTDGTGLERITYSKGFDGFPVFSPDGTKLVFGSNRHNAERGETNVFVADWIESPPGAPAPAERAADRVMKNIRWLADDGLAGRGVGTDGLAEAAATLQMKLTELAVPGAMKSGSFEQAFEVPVAVEQSPKTSVTLDRKALAADAFTPASFSSSGTVKARTVFAGYGIVSKKLGIDDYKGKRVRGKIVVVRRFVPTDRKLDTRAKRQYSDLRYKAFQAREHGARGLIVVDVPAVDSAKKGKRAPADAPLPALVAETSGAVGIPVVVVTRAAGAKLVTGRHRAAIRVGLVQKNKKVVNVVGKISAGAANKLPGAVVIGAHYDHLGMGHPGSLEPGKRVIHNGADDNASGTAALLEVARTLSKDSASLRRDVYIVFFTAEESGILGSSYFTHNPPPGLAMKDVVAMLNMDMVGRMRKGQLSVLGGASGAEWSELVSPACDAARVRCSLGGSGYGPSDHTPFYASGAPVLHFFTGAHTDYHKSTDDADRINAAGAAAVAQVVAQVAKAVSVRDARVTYKKVPAPLPAGDRRSWGASLGSVPSYHSADKTPGVLLDGVVPGGAAEKGGIRRGDRIVAIGTTEIRTIQDLMYVLMQARPGQRRDVTVLRDGKRLTLPITFQKSRRRRR